MLAVLSPAKKLDFELRETPFDATRPPLSQHTAELLKTAKALKTTELARLMKLSDSLANLNHERFQHFSPKPTLGVNAKQAALAFAGDTYGGLQATDFDQSDFSFAQDHLRILSGLYGVLRPLDMIQPYRLEMGTRLLNPRGKDLYAFWQSHIASQLNRDFKALHTAPSASVLINLASTEYFTAVDRRALKARILTCVFKEKRDGQTKVIGFFAKKARGMMARHIVKNRLTEPSGLKDFSSAKYRFQPKLSTADEWVFVR
ncbi:MAG: hypothetical protein RJA70_127 [Pseudomonadota bacterium]|jgi:cytoplasmic iron level regulating protein YaaA (DUF328/UPF0246 family)